MPRQRFSFGAGALEQMREHLVREHARTVLLVTGHESYRVSGAEHALAPMLSDLAVTRFEDFARNPVLPDVERGVSVWRKVRPDLVIAVGGGSVIDFGKAINLMAAQEAPPAAILAQPSLLQKPTRPLIAVPTTAGTGSESTHFATVYVDGVKHSLAHEWLRPDYAIVEPDLTESMSPRLTAVTGLDALSQAIESYWAVGATSESQGLAASAIVRMWPTLAIAVRTPNAAARSNMAYGAHLAGCAIDISKTTAAHAVSYALTTRHGIAHGHAVALTLGAFFELNGRARTLTVNDPRGVEHVERTMAALCQLLGCHTLAAAARAWQELLDYIGIESNLQSLGVGPDAVEGLVAAVNAERLGNHPVQVTPSTLREILFGLVRGPGSYCVERRPNTT